MRDCIPEGCGWCARLAFSGRLIGGLDRYMYRAHVCMYVVCDGMVLRGFTEDLIPTLPMQGHAMPCNVMSCHVMYRSLRVCMYALESFRNQTNKLIRDSAEPKRIVMGIGY